MPGAAGYLQQASASSGDARAHLPRRRQQQVAGKQQAEAPGAEQQPLLRRGAGRRARQGGRSVGHGSAAAALAFSSRQQRTHQQRTQQHYQAGAAPAANLPPRTCRSEYSFMPACHAASAAASAAACSSALMYVNSMRLTTSRPRSRPSLSPSPACAAARSAAAAARRRQPPAAAASAARLGRGPGSAAALPEQLVGCCLRGGRGGRGRGQWIGALGLAWCRRPSPAAQCACLADARAHADAMGRCVRCCKRSQQRWVVGQWECELLQPWVAVHIR